MRGCDIDPLPSARGSPRRPPDCRDRDPLPFHLERAQRTISLGFFSRRRRVNPESSFSMLGRRVRAPDPRRSWRVQD
jgi:hypothetical protein